MDNHINSWILVERARSYPLSLSMVIKKMFWILSTALLTFFPTINGNRLHLTVIYSILYILKELEFSDLEKLESFFVPNHLPDAPRYAPKLKTLVFELDGKFVDEYVRYATIFLETTHQPDPLILQDAFYSGLYFGRWQ